ncbi:hypothetical protein Tco_0901901, partial [Tanacetum coccineum]
MEKAAVVRVVVMMVTATGRWWGWRWRRDDDDNGCGVAAWCRGGEARLRLQQWLWYAAEEAAMVDLVAWWCRSDKDGVGWWLMVT